MYSHNIHNVGHALGLLHSQQEDAVMQPGYPTNAFTFGELHDDDIRAAQTLYPELSGVGAIEKLRAVEGDHTYTPKSPYPTECHSQIDAALLIRGKQPSSSFKICHYFHYTVKPRFTKPLRGNSLGPIYRGAR